jgi:hypothetical protein
MMNMIHSNVRSLTAPSWPTLPIYDLFNDTVNIPGYTESKSIKLSQYIIKNYGLYKTALFMVYNHYT